MAKRALPPVGPVVPVTSRPGIVPGKAPVVGTKRKAVVVTKTKKVVPDLDADEVPTAVVVGRTRRPVPPVPPSAKKAPPPGPAARRTAMQALRAGKVAF